MSQTAHPTSLVTADWVGAFASLGDGSDGTYLLSPVIPDESKMFVCALGPLTDPGVDTGHAIHVRAMIDTLGGEPMLLGLRLENVSDGSVVATLSARPTSDMMQNIVLTLTEAQAALIENYAALQLRGFWYAGNTAFLWDAYAGADSYVLQVGTSSGASNTYDANVGTVTTYTLALNAGTYYWRAVAYQGTVALATFNETMVVVA